MKWNNYQENIFTFPKCNNQHGLIQAGPGTGKTTTMVETTKYIKEKTLFLAFSTKIAGAIQQKVPKHVEARTFNSFGWRVCRNTFPNVELDANKTFNTLKQFIDQNKDAELFYTLQGPMRRIVSILKNMKQCTTENWQDCADRCGMELPDWRTETQDIFENLLPEVYEDSIRNTRFMDYDDQVFQPIFRDLSYSKYPYVMVDESQDLNATNIATLQALADAGTRLLMVGDAFQAVYGFRGALTESMDILRQTFSPQEYELPVCFRCPNAVIEMARKINPRLESPVPNLNGEGFTESIKLAKFREIVKPGEFVISRTTLPLVTEVLKLNLKGIYAYVEGKEVTENLFKLIDRIWYSRMQSKQSLSKLVNNYRCTGYCDSYDIVDFTDELRQDLNQRIPKLQREGKEELIDALTETTNTISAIADTVHNVPELIIKIETIFKEPEEINQPAVRAMSIHKVKGLENPIVHILYPSDIPHYRAVKSGKPWMLIQERNLRFVADTRSQQGTYYVDKP